MWNDRLDAKLLKLKREGFSFAEVGEQIGVTRNAALGRFQRLNGRIFPSQAERSKNRKARAKLKEETRARKDGETLRKLKAALADGADRTKAFKQAFAAGTNYRVIGDALGVTRQRAYQIANGL